MRPGDSQFHQDPVIAEIAFPCQGLNLFGDFGWEGNASPALRVIHVPVMQIRGFPTERQLSLRGAGNGELAGVSRTNLSPRKTLKCA
jgi:hypothetical protein